MFSLDPRTRLMTFLVVWVLLFIPSPKSLLRLGAIALVLLLFLPFAGRSLRLCLRSLVMASPLLILLAVSALGNQKAVSKTAFPMAELVGKTILVFLALAIFIQSEKPGHLLMGLRQFGLPEALTVILTLAYRFSGQLQLEMQGLHRAWMGHNFSALPKYQRIKLLGKTMPQFFERLLESSIQIHDAMIARGFDGFLPKGEHLEYTYRDVVFLGFVAGGTLAGVLLL